jgi:hypothetical protein
MPVNPQTGLQQVVRNALSLLTTRWGDLSDDQRANWAVYAANVPWVNTLGDSIRLTGNQMYTSCNTPRIQANLSVIDEAPTLFSTAALQGAGVDQNPTTPFHISFQWESGDLTDDDNVLIYASIARSPSINYFKGPYQYQGAGMGSGGNFVLVPNPSWVTGQKIFLRARISYADARLSSSWLGSYVLAHTPI